MEVEINGARIIATFDNVPLFGTVTITQTLIVSWLILIIISALFIWLGSGLKVTGISRKQAVAETIYISEIPSGSNIADLTATSHWSAPSSSPAFSPT